MFRDELRRRKEGADGGEDLMSALMRTEDEGGRLLSDEEVVDTGQWRNQNFRVGYSHLQTNKKVHMNSKRHNMCSRKQRYKAVQL